MTRLTPLDDALARWLEGVRPAEPHAASPLDAIGAALADPVRLSGPLPPAAVALRDGWPVASAETVGATGYAPAFLSAEPCWLQAGDPVPPGADAILPDAAMDRQGPVWACMAPAAPGDHVRRAGGDAPAGTVLAQAGDIVTPALAAAFWAAGIAQVQVGGLGCGSRRGSIRSRAGSAGPCWAGPRRRRPA